jgi:hypothetical protein
MDHRNGVALDVRQNPAADAQDPLGDEEDVVSNVCHRDKFT